MNDAAPTWFQMLPGISSRSRENPRLAAMQESFATSLLIAMFGRPPSAN